MMLALGLKFLFTLLPRNTNRNFDFPFCAAAPTGNAAGVLKQEYFMQDLVTKYVSIEKAS